MSSLFVLHAGRRGGCALIVAQAQDALKQAADYGFMLFFAVVMLSLLVFFFKRMTDRHLQLIGTLEKALVEIGKSYAVLADAMARLELKIERYMDMENKKRE